MRYCPRCGVENIDDARFCKNCGENMSRTIKYTKTSDARWDLARAGVLFIGAILVFTSLGLILGGSSLRMVQSTIVDSEGYIMSGVESLTSDSYAIVFEDLNIEFEGNAGPLREWFEDLIMIKLTAKNNDPSKNVFVGIADYDSANSYLNDVYYDRLIETNWEYDPWSNDFPDYVYSRHSGGAPTGPPTIHSFWAAFATGSDLKTLTWSVAPGRYWLIVMNEDASQGVEVEFQIGAKVPILKNLSEVLLTVGVLIGLVGAVVIYYGVMRW